MDLKEKHDLFSYAMGMSIADNLLKTGVAEVNVAPFVAAIEAILEKKKPQLSVEEANQIIKSYFEAKTQTESAVSGTQYLKENAEREGVVTTSSGLQYKVLRKGVGTGNSPHPSNRVKCHYEGRLINGAVFDSTYRSKSPVSFLVSKLIPGWVEALQLMKEGDLWELYVKPELAYGSRGAGQIGPNETLVFKLELLEILPD